MSIIEDELETTFLMTGKINQEFSRYDKIYPFTTENLTDSYKDLKDKTVLTVAGSGDQVLNAFNEGASQVDVFDINRLTIYYLRLKKCAIEHLTYEEFKLFFSYKSKELYEKIREYLGTETRQYWDYVYTHFILNPRQSLIYTYLFYPPVEWTKYKNRNNYMNVESYYKLQELLPSKTINFINTEVTDLHNKLKQKYDRIFLSNINQYLEAEGLEQVIHNLSNYLTEDGIIYFAYIYSYMEDTLTGNINHDDPIYIPSVMENDKQDTILSLKKASIN